MSTTQLTLAADADLAWARSVFYRFLATAFGYPKAGQAARLAEEVPSAEAAQALEAPGSVLEALAGVEERLKGLGDAELESEHVASFGHTVSDSWPPHETRYGSAHPFQETQDLADVTAFYSAFGLRTRQGAGERADHVWMELEFLHFLAAKQVVALSRGEEEGAQRTLAAAQGFLKDHLGRWGPVFGEILAGRAPDPLHRSLGALLVAVLRADMARLGVTPGAVNPAPIPLPPEQAAEDEDEDEDEDGHACGE